MTNSVLINEEQHGHSGWVPATGFEHAKKSPCIPVSVDEIAKLLSSYALAFISDKAKGSTMLIALTGNNKGDNVYIAPNGKWMAAYTPRAIRLYPFQISKRSGDEKEFALAFDMDSGCFRDSIETDVTALSFFDEGKPSKQLQGVLAGFNQEMKNRALTQKAIQALEKHQILRPWPEMKNLTVPGRIVGLQIIDENKLNEISPEALQELQRTGALAVAYAQLYSMQRLNYLQQLADLKQKHFDTQDEASTSELSEDLFSEGDDVLEFNF